MLTQDVTIKDGRVRMKDSIMECPYCKSTFQKDHVRTRMKKAGKDQQSFYSTKHCPNCDKRITLRDDNPNIESINTRLSKLRTYCNYCKMNGQFDEYRDAMGEILELQKQIEDMRNGEMKTKDAKNFMGERSFQTYEAWKRACKQIDPNVKFEGDKDICQAGKIGEWDGNEGIIYNTKDTKKLMKDAASVALKGLDKIRKQMKDRKTKDWVSPEQDPQMEYISTYKGLKIFRYKKTGRYYGYTQKGDILIDGAKYRSDVESKIDWWHSFDSKTKDGSEEKFRVKDAEVKRWQTGEYYITKGGNDEIVWSPREWKWINRIQGGFLANQPKGWLFANKSQAERVLREEVTDSKTKDATNYNGERVFQTYEAWKRACRQIDPNVKFDGDIDICQAGKIGEWDGDKGIIYNTKDSKKLMKDDVSEERLHLITSWGKYDFYYDKEINKVVAWNTYTGNYDLSVPATAKGFNKNLHLGTVENMKRKLSKDSKTKDSKPTTKDWLDPQAEPLSDKVVIKMKEIYKRTKEDNIYDLFSDATQALGISGKIKEDVRILTLQGANYRHTEQFVFTDSKPTAKDSLTYVTTYKGFEIFSSDINLTDKFLTTSKGTYLAAKTLEDLKKEIDSKPSAKDKALKALDSLKRRMKDAFGSNIEEQQKEFDTRNIEEETIKNNAFRKVVFTGNTLQLVLMSLLPNEDIGMEVHDKVDQFFRIEKGEGLLEIEGQGSQPVKDGFSILITAGTKHNVKNIGSEPLKLYTIYGPPNHPADRLQNTKAEAVKEEEESKKVIGDRKTKDADYYAIVNKKTGQVLSTANSEAEAKDELNGITVSNRNEYIIKKTNTPPKEWSMKDSKKTKDDYKSDKKYYVDILNNLRSQLRTVESDIKRSKVDANLGSLFSRKKKLIEEIDKMKHWEDSIKTKDADPIDKIKDLLQNGYSLKEAILKTEKSIGRQLNAFEAAEAVALTKKMKGK